MVSSGASSTCELPQALRVKIHMGFENEALSSAGQRYTSGRWRSLRRGIAGVELLIVGFQLICRSDCSRCKIETMVAKLLGHEVFHTKVMVTAAEQWTVLVVIQRHSEQAKRVRVHFGWWEQRVVSQAWRWKTLGVAWWMLLRLLLLLQLKLVLQQVYSACSGATTGVVARAV